jgi:hypothetical protein
VALIAAASAGSDRRASVVVSMSRPVSDGWRGRLQDGLRQLLPGFLQPPLVSRRIHDAGRATPGEAGFAGNEHRENDRTQCQRVFHILPARLPIEIDRHGVSTR